MCDLVNQYIYSCIYITVLKAIKERVCTNFNT